MRVDGLKPISLLDKQDSYCGSTCRKIILNIPLNVLRPLHDKIFMQCQGTRH